MDQIGKPLSSPIIHRFSYLLTESPISNPISGRKWRRRFSSFIATSVEELCVVLLLFLKRCKIEKRVQFHHVSWLDCQKGFSIAITKAVIEFVCEIWPTFWVLFFLFSVKLALSITVKHVRWNTGGRSLIPTSSRASQEHWQSVQIGLNFETAVKGRANFTNEATTTKNKVEEKTIWKQSFNVGRE